MMLSVGLSSKKYTEAKLTQLGFSISDNYVFAMQWYNHPVIPNFLLIGQLVPLSYLIVVSQKKFGIIPLNAPSSKPIIVETSSISNLSATKEKRRFYSYDGFLLQFTSHYNHYQFLVRNSFILKGMTRFTINAEKLYDTITVEK